MNTTKYNKYLNPEFIATDTNTIDLYHDLTRYLNEILVEMPEEKERKIIMHNILAYYKSLNNLLVKQALERASISKS